MSSNTIRTSSSSSSRGPNPIGSSAVHGSATSVNYTANLGPLPNRPRHMIYAAGSQYIAPDSLSLDQHCFNSTPAQIPDLLESLAGELVTLYVGQERKKFTAHRKLLCDSSDYFTAVFAGNFKEASEGAIEMIDDDIDAVGCLLEYLYRGRVPIGPKFTSILETKPEEILKVAETENAKVKEFEKRLRGAYYLAEKLCMENYMNCLMDAYEDHLSLFRTHITKSTTREIYENTHQESGMRKFAAAAMFHAFANDDNMREAVNRYEMLCDDIDDIGRDVLVAQFLFGRLVYTHLADYRQRTGEKSFGPCAFHVHTEGEDCGMGKS